MKTSELIDLLCATRLTVDPQRLAKGAFACGVAATILVILLVVATIGPRLDLAEAWRTPPVLLKLAFGASVAFIALRLFLATLKPGLSPARRLPSAALPFAALAVLAILTLAQAPFADWGALIFGRYWLACLVFVPLYALVPLGLLILLARQGAPVEPRLTGLTAGLAAGGLAVVAYALHCPDDAIPFLSTWYPLALAVSTAIGAILLPPLTHW